MAAPINNNLRNLPPAGLNSKTDSGSALGDNSSPALGATQGTTQSAGTSAPAAGSIPGSLSGNRRLLPGAGQNIDWFSDLDAGSKLPITVSDRFQGKSIQEMVDIIMGNLGLRP